MEIILLGIYSFFVWLIFIKFKLLPWTTPWKVAVAIIPVVAMATMLLVLNVVAPTTTDVRVVKYIVPIVSQVKGRVIEVPVENNRPVKKGDVLFRIDPTPYEAEVRALEAQLASEEAKVGAERAKVGETEARLPDAASTERQLNEELKEATSQVDGVGSLTRACPETCGAEYGARRHGGRESVRSGAGADHRQRARQSDRRRACRPATDQGKAIRPGRKRVRGCGGRQVPDHYGPGAGPGFTGASRDDPRPARERPLESGADDRARPGRRHDGERDAPARLTLCPAWRSTRS